MKNEPARRISSETMLSAEAIAKRLGSNLQKIRRADLTPELISKARLTPKDESRVVAVAEMSIQGMPWEVADALVASGAITSAAELAALEVEEVKTILDDPAVRRILPANFVINVELIQQWLQRIGPQTAQDEGVARGALSEDLEKSEARDDDEAAVATEDVMLSNRIIEELIGALQDHCRQGETAIKLLAKTSGDKLEASVVHDALLNLQTGLGVLVERFMVSQGGGSNAVSEDASESVEDEGIDHVKNIQELEKQYKEIMLRLDSIQILSETGDEEHSPAAAVEESKADTDEELKEESS